MKPTIPRTQEASGASRDRRRPAADGTEGIEVTVPSCDAPLVRAIAEALRLGGEEAEFIRRSLQPKLNAPMARTGSELVAILRASPLAELDLPTRRDRSVDRTVDFG